MVDLQGVLSYCGMIAELEDIFHCHVELKKHHFDREVFENDMEFPQNHNKKGGDYLTAERKEAIKLL